MNVIKKNITKVRFPNESYYIDILDFKWNEFKEEKIFEDIVFGWYGDIYISMPKSCYNEKF